MPAFFQRGKELLRVYRQVFCDLWVLSKKRVVAVLFFHTLGPLLLGAMIIVLTGAIRIITKKGEGDGAAAGTARDVSGGYADALGADLWSFGGVAAVVSILGLAGAFLCWKAMYISRKLARSYRVSMTGRMIEQVAGYSVETSDLSLELGAPSNISSIFLRGPLQSSVAARLVLSLVRPIVMIFSFLGVLVILSWKLTLILIPLLLLPLPFIYALNRSTHGASHRFYLGGGRKRFTGVMKEALGVVNQVPVSSQDIGLEQREAYESNEEVNLALDDYDFSILARTRSQYYTSVFQAILIGAGVFGFGLAAIWGWLSWEIIIGALIALKGVQQAVTVMWGMIASLVRKFPVVRNTQQFITALSPSDDADITSDDRKPVDRDSHHFLIASPIPALRTTIPGMLEILKRSGQRMQLRPGESLFVSKAQPVPATGEWLEQEDVPGLVKDCFSLPEEARSEAWKEIPESDRIRALFLSRVSPSSRLLILAASPGCVSGMGEWIQSNWRKLDVVSVCCGWPDDEPLEIFDTVIAHDGEEVVRSAPGSEWEGYRQILAEQHRKANSDFDDSEFEDDDDE